MDYDAMRELFDNDYEDACYMLRHAWDCTARRADKDDARDHLVQLKHRLKCVSDAVDALDTQAARRITRSVTSRMRDINAFMRDVLSELSYC